MVIMEKLPASPSSRRREGFTFVEILVALGIMVLFSATALASFTQFNRYAMASRLRAHALSLAQQRIDEVLTTQWRVNAARPTVLNAGTTTESTLVLNADEKNKQASLKSAFTDLVSPVTATRRTVITNVSSRLVRAEVTVTFTYAKRTYTVALTTMRTTDNI